MLAHLPHASARLACLLLLLGAASAQQPHALAVESATRHAGTYHMATGTWTRGATTSAALGPSVIYNNTAPSGYFSSLGLEDADDFFSITDEGRVPTTQSSLTTDIPVVQDTYVVTAIEFGYCTTSAPSTFGLDLRIYDTYSVCDLYYTFPEDPLHLAGVFSVDQLPGSQTGSVECWTVTIDASGGGEFCFQGDGGALSTGSTNFGVEWVFDEGAYGEVVGPMLAGDPDWTRSLPGALRGGGGTYYAGETCAEGATGLDTFDNINVQGPGALFTYCGFFGGYLNTNGCGGPQNNPLASLHTILYADLAATSCGNPLVQASCEPAALNSAGTAVELTAVPTALGAGYRLEATGGPILFSPGFFVMSETLQQPVQIGQGSLCLAGPIGRYNPVNGTAGNSLGIFDSNGVFANVAGTSTTGFGFDLPEDLPPAIPGQISVGNTYHFQLWYRDLNPQATVNFSNGLSIQY